MTVTDFKDTRIKTYGAARRFVAQRYLSPSQHVGSDGLTSAERKSYSRLYAQQTSGMSKADIEKAVKDLKPVNIVSLAHEELYG